MEPQYGGVSDETLAQSKQRYASMFTHHPHATYSLDPRGHYTEANPRALEMTGLSLEEMRRIHFARVIHPDDLHLVEAGFARAMTGLGQVVEARVVRADGVLVDFRTTMMPVVIDGEIVGVHGVTEDITEAKRVLRELEEANAAKTRFLATVSHELRTPLAALVGATDLLIDDGVQPGQERYVSIVERSGQRLLQLVHDMLEFSSLEARRTELHRDAFALGAVVDDLAEWATPLAASRGLAITFTIDDALPEVVVGDRARLTQVATNLVHNALVFTETGAVTVRLVPSTRVDGHDRVALVVTDTGIGIAPDRIAALFEPFTQPPTSSARVPRGTGLGLAICRDLADLMGGRLEVTSELGVGSTFTLDLPLCPAPEPGARAAGRPD